MIAPLISAALHTKVAATRHLVGAGLGAAAGWAGAHLTNREEAQRDALLRDLGVMPPVVYGMRDDRRGSSALAGALGGAGLGAVGAHYAPQIYSTLAHHAHGALRSAGQSFGEGAADVAGRSARDVGREFTEGAAEAAGRAAQEHAGPINDFVENAARRAGSGATEGAADTVRQGARSLVPDWLKRFASEE